MLLPVAVPLRVGHFYAAPVERSSAGTPSQKPSEASAVQSAGAFSVLQLGASNQQLQQLVHQHVLLGK